MKRLNVKINNETINKKHSRIFGKLRRNIVIALQEYISLFLHKL